MMKLGNKKGISPVIATVIIVAVTIAVSIAVAYWMGGLTTYFTRFEKIEIGSAYASVNGTDYDIKLNTVKNTGSADASITAIYINGKLPTDFTPNPTMPTLPIPIVSGAQKDLITIKAAIGTPPFTAGTTLSITIHTASGKDYPVSVALP